MRHRHKTKKLQRNKAQRRALLANQACSLIEEGEIRTTLAKAKALRPVAEKMVTLGKKESRPNQAEKLQKEFIIEGRLLHFLDRKKLLKLFSQRLQMHLLIEKVGTQGSLSWAYAKVMLLQWPRLSWLIPTSSPLQARQQLRPRLNFSTYLIFITYLEVTSC